MHFFFVLTENCMYLHRPVLTKQKMIHIKFRVTINLTYEVLSLDLIMCDVSVHNYDTKSNLFRHLDSN